MSNNGIYLDLKKRNLRRKRSLKVSILICFLYLFIFNFRIVYGLLVYLDFEYNLCNRNLFYLKNFSFF